MKVTHLNCGSMREIPAPGRAAAPAVCHVLVVEADHGLVLVETGFGAVDVEQPEVALGAEFLARTAPVLSSAETAAAQLVAHGYDPADVTDIVLTHLDLDHCGGLPDFPAATVHVHDAEYRTAMAVSSGHPEHLLRYRPAHWAHRPRWSTYPTRRDSSRLPGNFECGSRSGAGADIDVDGGWVPSRSPEVAVGQARISHKDPRTFA